MMAWKSSFSLVSFISKQIGKKSLYRCATHCPERSFLFTVGEYLFTRRQFSTSVKMECCGNAPDFSKEALKKRTTAQQYQVTQEKDTERMTNALEYEIRGMKKEEIPDVVNLWQETDYLLGGLNEVSTWYEYDPEGFIVAVTKDGEVIGVLAGILQYEELAFFGMYVVKSGFRGRGVGQKIWKKVMERIGDRNAATNPVPEQTQNYKDRGGFPIQCDWGSVVFQLRDVCLSKMINELPGIDVDLVSPDDANLIKSVAEYDADVIGFPRNNLFPILLKDKESIMVVSKNSSNNTVCGYGVIKQSIKNVALVGPLYADDESIAELILYHLIKAFPVAVKEGVAVMATDCNHDNLGIWERLDFHRHSTCLRLYRHKEVKCHFEKVFALFNDNFCVF